MQKSLSSNMEVREQLRYTKTHEWVLPKDGTVRVGVTDRAQDQLTDVVFAELPEVGTACVKGDVLATLESVKSVAEVFSPVTGTVTAVNERLNDEPGLINASPYDDGWLVELALDDKTELDDLLSAQDYESLPE
jgi:glycine cleavage system H protein